MKRSLYVLLLFAILPLLSLSQTKEERKELILLLNERQEKFDYYTNSLKEKSGIFGQKTKNDLRDSHDKLKQIIEVDNRIMTRLRQMLDYKNFEKQTMFYDMVQYTEKIKNLERNQDTLLKQLEQLEKQKDRMNKASTWTGKALYFFLGIITALLFFRLRKRYYKKF